MIKESRGLLDVCNDSAAYKACIELSLLDLQTQVPCSSLGHSDTLAALCSFYLPQRHLECCSAANVRGGSHRVFPEAEASIGKLAVFLPK